MGPLLDVSSIALTEAPLAVGVPGTASPAVVAVVVVVVVVRVVSPSPRQESVLHVPVVHPHSCRRPRHPKGGATDEPGSYSETQRLLAESLASVLANTSWEAGAKLCSVTRRFVV